MNFTSHSYSSMFLRCFCGCRCGAVTQFLSISGKNYCSICSVYQLYKVLQRMFGEIAQHTIYSRTVHRLFRLILHNVSFSINCSLNNSTRRRRRRRCLGECILHMVVKSTTTPIYICIVKIPYIFRSRSTCFHLVAIASASTSTTYSIILEIVKYILRSIDRINKKFETISTARNA